MSVFEKRVLCDNCGRLVQREKTDAAEFQRLAQQAEPDEDDLFEDNQERAVQVFVIHVPVCGHCREYA